MDRRERRVLLGRVVGVHGVRGGVKVDSFTDPRDRILEYQPWILRRNGAEKIVRAKSLVRHGKVVACIVPAGNAATAPSWRGIAAQPRPENPAG